MAEINYFYVDSTYKFGSENSKMFFSFYYPKTLFLVRIADLWIKGNLVSLFSSGIIFIYKILTFYF